MSSNTSAWRDNLPFSASPPRSAHEEGRREHSVLAPLSPPLPSFHYPTIADTLSPSSSTAFIAPPSLLSPALPYSPHPSFYGASTDSDSAFWLPSSFSPVLPSDVARASRSLPFSPLRSPLPLVADSFPLFAQSNTQPAPSLPTVASSPPPSTGSSSASSTSESASPPPLPASPHSHSPFQLAAPTKRRRPAPEQAEADEQSEHTSTSERRRTSNNKERRSHRQLDATRRAKESAAMKKLDQLTTRETREQREAEESEEGGEGGGRKRLVDAKKREKLTVLESSIEHIERLQALVDRLVEAGNAKDSRMHQLTHHLRSVAAKYAQMEERTASSSSSSSSFHQPPSSASTSSSESSLSGSAVEYVNYLDRHHALYSSIFLHSCLVMMLMDLDTAVIIDANSRFEQQTGFVRQAVLGKRINGKGAHDQLSQAAAAHYEAVQVRDRSAATTPSSRWNGGSTECDDELPWIDVPLVRQYPSSVRLLIELREGRRESFRAPWRCIFADGRLVEVESVCVVAKRRWVVEADGTRWERPASLLVANGWTDVAPVDTATGDLLNETQ